MASVALAQTGPVITYLAPVNPDGCSFCCEFACQLTPTPAPSFDAQGRRVYTRSQGRFLFILEAKNGSSGRSAGSQGVNISPSTGSEVLSPIIDPSGKPDLQLLVTNAIGNGSTVKCDTKPPNSGGVPGVPSLNFDGGPAVTDALVDMACRFTYVTSAATSCTRDRFGNFAFLGPGSTRQYCFQVPDSAAFASGDTTVAAQLRDSIGNLGPAQQIVIRVVPAGQATPTPTRTPTPLPSATISGRVRYYSADRAVPGATVNLSGGVQSSTTSSSTGAYAFSGLPHVDVAVEPQKNGDFRSGISSLDASYILQFIVAQRSLSSMQQLACDVTGNGSVSSLDASRILQYVVGQIQRFPVATTCNSDWAFIPMPAAAPNQQIVQPLVSTGTCQHGRITFNPLTATATQQDFYALLFGDCTGNWQPPATASSLLALAGNPPLVRLGRARRTRADRWRVPLWVSSGSPFYSLDLRLTLGSLGRAAAPRVRLLSPARRAMLRAEADAGGTLTVALASGEPLAPGRRPLLLLEIPDAGSGARAPRLSVLSASIDDHRAAVR